MKSSFSVFAGTYFAFFAFCSGSAVAQASVSKAPASIKSQCPRSAGLKLPAGFCATIFADSVGAARHMVVSAGGDVLVNLQGARRGSPVSTIGTGQIALRDNDKNGRADVTTRLTTQGSTGIGLYRDYVYADIGTAIIRYRISWDSLKPITAPDTVVFGLPGAPGHTARNFEIAGDGTMYVNIGSATNSCQEKDRAPASDGREPCTELETRAGVWRFDADLLKQEFTPAKRYATGLRNSVALRLGPKNQLYAVPHGRDQLFASWPALFTESQNAELPAEVLVTVDLRDDYGWPYCYFDGIRGRLVLAPEYGGDGTKVGRCSEMKSPLIALPAHWSPIDMLFYTGKKFPERYRNGVFISFHGSWNRAPLPQAGYNVVFVPFIKGVPSPKFEVFADNFTSVRDPSKAEHRPAGLAQAPDGSLLVSDDVGGRIWRITYSQKK